MRGLLFKDIINLKQQAKIYLLIIAIWIAISFANNDNSFFGGLIMIFSILVPISTIAYDEKAKWDRYALTMPVSRKDIVLSKYLLAFCCAAMGAVLSTVVSIIMSKDITESLLSSMMFMSLGISVASIVLPIIFKFGVEKGRMLMLAVFLAPTVIGMILSKLNINMTGEYTFEMLSNFSPLIALVVTAISIIISVKIYNSKEL